MKAYIALSYHKREELKNELTIIKETLLRFEIEPFIFIEKYDFKQNQEQQMMNQAMQDIDSCDILIAETSEKGIGIGIEVGFAKAKKKPIIYARLRNAEHSTTVSGISDFQIIYDSGSDLQAQLEKNILLIQDNLKK
jgi:nucleoside 2-deoxyribosyltransferase